MTQTLDEFSALLLYLAMGVYAISFIAFTLDLARRSAGAAVVAESAADRVARARGAARGSAAGSVATLDPPRADAPARPRESLTLRVGVTLAILGWVLHLGATVLRGVAGARVPWANMYEFSMTGTLIIMGVFLLLLARRDLRFLGAIITGMVVLMLGVTTVGFRVDVVPLPPALQSYWLVIHVLVAILATAFFTVGAALSIVQLVRARRENGPESGLRLPVAIPGTVTLENWAYRVNIVGFIFWTFTLIAGAIWAEHAWGRYWGWDTKEVWTFIIWVIYAGYIHARATRGWRGSRSAWLAIVGYSAVLFNFGIVNVFFKGLHAYSGL
ncbi:c-type cytochrome biogenesis protein CcsB [Naasia sp. SYSU D00948]|uniref:c-type cytochrome biogenesis protein CcsB n=1 Tax=Naasia sp. SYSU D00948 TaxID=2817379 RepID=UPI0027DCD4A7|nr:c-type cytochrome biogenesis protein CcsB [Naasia sp. SYSU D00948]